MFVILSNFTQGIKDLSEVIDCKPYRVVKMFMLFSIQ